MNVHGYKIPIFKILLKPAIASLIMGLVIITLTNINILIVILISTIIYFIALYILKTFSEEDITLFKQIIGRVKQ
jgi:hypothetical protein